MVINPKTHNLHVDIESFSEVDLKKCGAWKYWEHPSAEILLFGCALDDNPVRVFDLTSEKLPPAIVDALKSPEVLLSGWNVGGFEWLGLSKHLNYELPIEKLRDVMLHAAYLGFPLSLEAAGAALGLAEDKKKLATGKSLIRYFSVPCKPTKVNGGRTRNLPEHDPAKFEEYKVYNGADVESERAIDNMLAPWPVPEKIQEQWQWDLVETKRGVGVDMVLVQGAIDCHEQVVEELTREAIALTGLDNPNSVQQLSKWLSEATENDVDNLRKDTVKDMLGADLPSETVRRVLEIRQELGKTSVKKYHSIENCVCSDNRVRGLIQFYGATRTGRNCLAEGTLILTKGKDGEIRHKPIAQVAGSDFVWDGTDWVTHDGVVFSGEHPVISWDGVTATASHGVWVSPDTQYTLLQAQQTGTPLWKGEKIDGT